MALCLPIGPSKNVLGWSRYRDANPVPTNPLADDIGAGYIFLTWIKRVSEWSSVSR